MKRFLVLILMGSLSACALSRKSASRTPDPTALPKDDAAIAAAVATATAQSNKMNYRISGADLLQITVFGEKDLDRLTRVGQRGSISLPLIGQIKVGGLTAPKAEQLLAKAFSDYIKNPQVTIFIKEYGNKKVFVFGQVKKPGAIELPTETQMTVLEAISQAGGFTKISAPNRTRIVRSVKGVGKTLNIDVSAITKKGQKDKDLPLEPNDIVFVPESRF
jgi:protein involved in polysaccharide export with SLBB domain